MAATLEETMVTYEELSDLEHEFDDVETEIIRQQYLLSKPLYAKRAELVAKIPKFWPLVLEQAPMDIDEYIQPSDSALLLSALTSLSVSRFEIDADEKKGDPRSVAIRFEFADNEHFEDKVLEKKFWWRYSKDGYATLVSEPVQIKWKKGKDLTDGLLDLVKAVWDEQQAAPKKAADKKEKVELTEKQKALKEKIDKTGLGGVSFFAWFGYIGEYISAEESKEAFEKEEEARKKRKAGEAVEEEEDEEEEDDEDEDDEDEEEDELDIFPTGDAVAMAITDDLWPGALKYFSQAQEQDVLSELDFESGSEDDEEEEEGASPAERPQKKRRGCAHGCDHH